MQKVLTAAQMREVDRRTADDFGIPSIVLMENAAHAVARVITEKQGGSVKGKSIVILCGPGNNGGDGAALARILWRAGAFVTAELIGERPKKGDASTNFNALEKIIEVHAGEGRFWYREWEPTMAENNFDDWLHMSNFDQSDVVVDALFGTGLTRPLEGFYAELAGLLGNWKREYGTPLIVSVDIPSGLHSDTAETLGNNIEAHVTVTFTAPKAGNVVPPASSFNGELIVADIGSPRILIDGQQSDLYLTEKRDAVEWLEKSQFDAASYKNKRGHALLVAGSANYTGAAVLAGDAAIRSGAGLVTLAVPESSRESVISRIVPEVMVRGIAETDEGSAAERSVDEIAGFLKNVDAIAIGSGLSTKAETAAFVRRMVEERTMPLVVDADGLTALSPLPMRGRAHDGDRPPLILTPHEGEFRKLLGLSKEEADQVLKDRVAAVRDLAAKHQVILVLKGERVLIGAPDGRVIVNPTGNSGLGKAGNGDTLTGIIIGFVAQAVQMKIDIVETVIAACYVAGMAGDIAERKYGKRVMTASDVRDCLVDVFDDLSADSD